MTSTETLIPEPTAIVLVPFYCQARYAPELQQGAAELLRRLSAGASAEDYSPPFKSTDGDRDAWNVPEWSRAKDKPAARWLMNDLPENQRRIVACLVAGGPDGTTTGTALRFGGYGADTSASPVFKAIGGRFRKVGRKPIWRGGEQTETGQNLPVPDGEPRDLFIDVIRADHLALAAELGL